MAILTLSDGVSLSYSTAGTGRPVLLLHGFTGSAASWRMQAPVLAERFRVTTLDLLGHGLSDSPVDFSRYRMERCLEDLAAVIETLGLSGCTVAGYSMGGRVALALAIEQPQLVEQLVLESASPGLKHQSEREARCEADEELATFMESAGIERFVDRWERQPLWASQSALADESRQLLRAERLRNNATGLSASLRGLGTGRQASYWERLGEVRAPTLVVAGQLDGKFSDIASEMYLRLPIAELSIVSGAGHAVHLEKPQVYNRLLIEFMEKERDI